MSVIEQQKLSGKQEESSDTEKLVSFILIININIDRQVSILPSIGRNIEKDTNNNAIYKHSSWRMQIKVLKSNFINFSKSMSIDREIFIIGISKHIYIK